MNRKMFALMMALMLVFSLAFVACGDDDDDENNNNPAEGTEGGACKTMETPTACDDDNPCDTGYTCTEGFCVADVTEKLFEAEEDDANAAGDDYSACVGKDISMGLCNLGLFCDTDVICKLPENVTDFDMTICGDDTPECDDDNPCDEGYSCVEGACVEDTVDPCDPNPCENDGEICTADETATDGYTCACDTDMELYERTDLAMCVPVDYCVDGLFNTACNEAKEFAVGAATGGDDCEAVTCTEDAECAYLAACDDPDNLPTITTFICDGGSCVRGEPAAE